MAVIQGILDKIVKNDVPWSISMYLTSVACLDGRDTGHKTVKDDVHWSISMFLT